ncbi:MAG: hypothetical protein H0W06_09390 [Chloroflexia bacterium]|nr:hypothetical protein [Chloroflexia bacterium]
MIQTRTFQPRWPKLSELDADRLVLDFDHESDTLLLHFYDEIRPSISVPLDDHYLALVDPVTEEVVGIQMEGFLAQVAFELPSVLDLADVIGLSPDERQRLQAGLTPRHRKRALLESLFGHVAPGSDTAA